MKALTRAHTNIEHRDTHEQADKSPERAMDIRALFDKERREDGLKKYGEFVERSRQAAGTSMCTTPGGAPWLSSANSSHVGLKKELGCLPTCYRRVVVPRCATQSLLPMPWEVHSSDGEEFRCRSHRSVRKILVNT